MKPYFLLLILIVLNFLTSCENPLRKKLGLKIIENDEVILENYRNSTLTTVHQFIDITNKRWNRTERILEANSNCIENVIIRNDTIFLQKTNFQEIIYDLAAIKYGYTIILLEPTK